jgi:tetratricopeptide (TPR) repeat protein
LALALLTTPFTARADTIWQKAQSKWKAQKLLGDDELHRDVAVKLAKAQSEKPLTTEWFSLLSGATTVLNEQHASERADARIKWDIGLVAAKLRRCSQATVALEAAYTFSKNHPLAEDGLFELAICYSKLGDHAMEENAYLRAIDATDRQFHKAVIYSNLAESRMAQGKLEEGIDAAESSILLDPDNAASRYNLAILKDRSGDPSGALEAAKHAVELDPKGEYLDGDGVFFEPAYEKHWYHALQSLALAERDLGDEDERKVLLMSALGAYQHWLEESEPTDRFRKRCEEAITRLEKRLKLKKKK